MGALPPSVYQWLPQDDLLLKNAVEAGASLESLAKGAVRFSQMFTVQELQDRWHSLLYNSVISAEASVHMIDFERSASNAKFNKDAKCIPGKRKTGSVRKCYSAMRKRICSEPFDSVDIGSLGVPSFIDAGKHDEPLCADYFLGVEDSEFFANQESNIGIMHHPLVTDFDQYKELQTCDLFDDMDLDIQSLPVFEEIIDTGVDASSGFESKVFNSSTSDCVFGSSPIPEMPAWSSDEFLSPHTLADVLGETEGHAGNDILIPDDFDANGPSIPGYSSVNSQSELQGQITVDGVKDSVPNSEEYFAEISNTLLNFFTEDDLLFVDAEGKDLIDECYIENFSSILLESPGKNDVAEVRISEVAVVPHEHLSDSPGAAHPGESGDPGNHCDDQHIVWNSEAQKLSSALRVNPAFPELRNGVICCTLNIEDPEIPNNDDVFLPIRLSSMSISETTDTKFQESYYPMPSSVNEFSNSQKPTDRAHVESGKSNYLQLHVPSRMKGSLFQLGRDSPRQIDDRRETFVPPLNSDTQHVALRKVTTSESPALVNSSYCSNKSIVPGSGKELVTKIEQPKHLNSNPNESHIQKLAQASDPHLRFQKNAAGSKQNVDGNPKIQDHEALNGEFFSVEETAEEAIAVPTASDQEELFCDSDDNNDDVPYFSDVEAMILDMDLSPDDQDLYCSSEVLRYKHEDSRRTIIRLEQAADAHLQRALSAQGAFAVLYGRRAKHFIKKTEVLLGRPTENFEVDIDLGMEGHPNKISRRQATIKMGNAGSFHLTNHGKFSIYVNGKEVNPRENVGLVSGCLIEVRGLPFLFETSSTCIKQYLDNIGDEGYVSC